MLFPRFLLLTLVSICCVSTAVAQKKLKTGTITFVVTAVDTDVPELDLMKGTERTVTFNTKKISTEIKMNEETVGMRSIKNLDTGTETHLIDLPGKKYAVVYSAQNKEPTIPAIAIDYPSDVSKTILGYSCYKAEINIEGEVIHVWVTDKIKSQLPDTQTVFPNLKGYPLEYTLPAEHAKITFTAQTISETVNAADFEIPGDYEILQEEEFREKTGGRRFGF